MYIHVTCVLWDGYLCPIDRYETDIHGTDQGYICTCARNLYFDRILRSLDPDLEITENHAVMHFCMHMHFCTCTISHTEMQQHTYTCILCESPKVLGRADDLKAFVMHNCDETFIEIQVRDPHDQGSGLTEQPSYGEHFLQKEMHRNGSSIACIHYKRSFHRYSILISS